MKERIGRTFVFSVVSATLLLGASACEEKDPVGPVGDSVPASIEASPTVVGIPGETVEARVRVRAAEGEPIEGIGVRFEPRAGDGVADPPLAVTDAEGFAVTVWTLGELVGVQRLSAHVTGFEEVALELEAEVFAIPEAFAAPAAGAGFSCAPADDGRLFCWGRGEEGQLGNHVLQERATPVPVASGETFSSVSAGEAHACAVTGEGPAFCWGDNEGGRLGTGNVVDAPVPAPVAGGMAFATVAAGRDHTCGLTPDGEAHCWGLGEGGRLGTGTESGANLPRPVEGALRFRALSAGPRHTCALTLEGEAYCWGEEGPWLGTEPSASHLVPGPVSGGLSFASISVGESHTCAVTGEGDAYCWGRGEGGRLGTGSGDDESRAAPVPVGGGLRFLHIAAGDEFTCGLALEGEGGTASPGASDTEGVAWCWGRGTRGQLGDGGSGSDHVAAAPVPVSTSARFTAIDAAAGPEGSGHVCALTAGGEVRCWGSGRHGQLGTGGTGEGYHEPEPQALWSRAGG